MLQLKCRYCARRALARRSLHTTSSTAYRHWASPINTGTIPQQHASLQLQSRCMAVYAFGHGWTGALGTGRLDDHIKGHDDEENPDVPHCLWQGDVLSVAAGWGHSAIITHGESRARAEAAMAAAARDKKTQREKLLHFKKPKMNGSHETTTTTSSSSILSAVAGVSINANTLATTSTATALPATMGPSSQLSTKLHYDNRLLVCGRPHDFQALLRLNRFSPWLRNLAVQFAHSYKENENALNPTALVGRFIAWAVNEHRQPRTFFGLQLSPSQMEQEELVLWEVARQFSSLSQLEEMPMPYFDAPGLVAASAGITAVVGQQSGTLYMCGLNNRGQCGVGTVSNNEWILSPVMGLSQDYAAYGREFLTQAYPIRQVALGLQHGYAICTQGNLYAWGKNERSQLGHDGGSSNPNPGSIGTGPGDFARHVRKACELHGDEKPDYFFLPPVVEVAAGYHHGVALTETNQVFIWGRNVLKPFSRDAKQGKLASDAPIPMPVQGLPPDLAVVHVACGSHHTAILLEDGSVYAMGVPTDTLMQLLLEPTLVVPPGVINMPVRQFEGAFDRTTIVGNDGTQVLQFHLWHDPELRDFAVFIPFWVDLLLEENLKIRSVHRGWLHTLVVTDPVHQEGEDSDMGDISEPERKLLEASN